MKRILQKLRRRLRGQRTSARREQDHRYARPFGEQLEPRRLLSADLALWHNYAMPEDVTGDGRVSMRDAAAAYGALLTAPSAPYALQPAKTSALSPEGQGEGTLFPDVNGDNFVTPIDARLVANALLPEGQRPTDLAFLDVRIYDPVNGEQGTGDNVAASLEQGIDFELRIYVQDVRSGATGVARAFSDVAITQPSGVDVVESTGDIVHDFPTDAGGELNDYDDFPGGTVLPGLINDAGGIQSGFIAGTADPLGPGAQLLFSVPFTASDIGDATFATGPAGDVTSDALAILLWGATDNDPPVIVDPGLVYFDDLVLTVTRGPLFAEDDLFDGVSKPLLDATLQDYPTVAEGSSGVPLDVLANDIVQGVNPTSPYTGLSIIEVASTNGSGATTAPTTLGGTVTVNVDGTVSYTPPTPNFISSGPTGGPGPDSFTYTVQDSETIPNQATATVYVTVVNVVNDQPTAVDDNVLGNDPRFTTDEDTPLEFAGGLLTENDIDPDFQVLTVTSVGTSPPLPTNVDGEFVYTPPASLNSMQEGDPPFQDTYTYVVSDGTNQATGMVTFTVTGVNDAPVVSPQTPTTGDNTPYVVDLDLLGVTDPEGDGLTYSLVSGTSAREGTISIGPGNVLTYNPDTSPSLNALLPGSSLPDTFTVLVTDIPLAPDGTPLPNVTPRSSTMTFTITVNGEDDNMTAASPAPIPGYTNTPITFYAGEDLPASQTPNIGENVHDPDSGVSFTVPGTTDGGGRITRNPDGSFTYDPNGAFDSVAYPNTTTDTFTYTVTSATDPTDVRTVTVTLNLEVDIRMPDVEGSVIYGDVNDNGVRDPWERTISGVRLELTGTDITGQPINMVDYTDADGGFSFEGLIRGNYVLRQYTPRFIVDDDGPGVAFDEVAINSPADASRDFFFGEFGLHPHYIVIDDYFGSFDNNGIMFGLDASGQQLWYSLQDGWGTATTVSAQMSADGSSLRVTVNGRAFTVPTIGNPDFLLRGTSPTGNGSVVQIFGTMDQYL